MTYTAVVCKEEEWYVAECPETGTVSQGQTLEEAIANLREATALYLDEFAPPVRQTPFLTTLHSSLAIGTLRGALRQANVEPDAFVEAYRR